MARSVAHWKSRRGKYWLDLLQDKFGYYYRSDDGGGTFDAPSDEEAIKRLEDRLSDFAPSKLYRVDLRVERKRLKPKEPSEDA